MKYSTNVVRNQKDLDSIKRRINCTSGKIFGISGLNLKTEQ